MAKQEHIPDCREVCAMAVKHLKAAGYKLRDHRDLVPTLEQAVPVSVKNKDGGEV